MIIIFIINIAQLCYIKFNLKIVLTEFVQTYGIPCRDILSFHLIFQMAVAVNPPEKQQKIQKYQAHCLGSRLSLRCVILHSHLVEACEEAGAPQIRGSWTMPS